ncbi:formate-dependent phosphoribosylglycinamide formyltransferase [Sinobaca qinghaiensis]|uniref:Formate-dependent phosphoribosylglycinamide formyltransferase n=1 Tax=Sinobaca qinghaiensis TaxID=342944 RepID=A0A419V6E2_9BACL|nr:formate-dependent phosphoribosylglycinamide formyltransferase [Sinobaca qinghaiensis]RKD75552.1 formate-dependent phosphoribosylglycinamide formyltransferase [Sinobaca qinghaiensis]
MNIGAPLQQKGIKLMILGSGELGKEVIMEAQRLGVETIAVDRYDGAPAMQTAHRSYVIDMLEADKLKEIVRWEKPDYIVPEIEALATEALIELEEEGFRVIPTARAAHLTMDREGIRRLASEELKIPTASYQFADNIEELASAVKEIGTPCVIKPVMSSSGKGQTVCRSEADIETSWQEAVGSGRGKKNRVIVESFIPFESEITLLTVQSISGTSYCEPIGHEQKDGDYIQSWQPHPMPAAQLEQAKKIASEVTAALGGYGLFGVELFLTKDHVYFSEVSPRPHDTGMVTLATQHLSEFALHVRAVLGLPVEDIVFHRAGASYAVKAEKESKNYHIEGAQEALLIPETELRIFGKPETKPGRRMAVAISLGADVEEAKQRSKQAAEKINIIEE